MALFISRRSSTAGSSTKRSALVDGVSLQEVKLTSGLRLWAGNTLLFVKAGKTPTLNVLWSRDLLPWAFRLVAIARGEQEYFDPSGIPTATEGCKSNALMRCSKDLGIASELWCVSNLSEHDFTALNKGFTWQGSTVHSWIQRAVLRWSICRAYTYQKEVRRIL